MELVNLKKVTDEQRVREYMDEVFAMIKQRDRHEQEFIQTVKEIYSQLIHVFEKHTKYEDNGILERITETERIITFQIPWVDDHGKVKVNRDYRVQFNSAISPYKGGIRFHTSVNTSIVKFLGLQEIFKNSLSGQPIGGGKGGADFDPKGKSDG